MLIRGREEVKELAEVSATGFGSNSVICVLTVVINIDHWLLLLGVLKASGMDQLMSYLLSGLCGLNPPLPCSGWVLQC